MGNKRLLLAGVGLMGEGYLRAARELGLEIGLVEVPSRIEEYRERADAVFECVSGTDEHWVGATVAAARDWQPDVVVAFGEPQVVAAGFVQDMLNLSGPSLQAAVASRDKGLQRTLLEAADVVQPEFALVRNVEEALEFADSRYPVVVKELRSSGSRGVSLAADAADVSAAVGTFGVNNPVLVESFVDGPEYSCELIVCDGRVVFTNYTRKITTGAPEFVEIGHVLPVSFGADQSAVDSMVGDVVAGLGIRTSLVHMEFRLAQGCPYVLETAVRTPGDHIMELLSLAYDQDMFAQVLKVYLGDPTGLPTAAAEYAAIRYLQPEPGSFLRAEVPEDLPGVVRLELPYQEDEVIVPLRSSGDRRGYAITRAGSERELVERVEESAAAIKVITA